jgi:hypothetical protein
MMAFIIVAIILGVVLIVYTFFGGSGRKERKQMEDALFTKEQENLELREKVNSLAAKQEKVEQEYYTLQREFEMKVNSESSLKEELTKLNALEEKQKSEIEILNAENASLKDKLMEREKDYMYMVEELKILKTNMSSENVALKEKVKNLEIETAKTISAKEKEISRLREGKEGVDYAAFKKEIEQLKKKELDLKLQDKRLFDLEILRAENAALKDKLMEKEKENISMHEELRSLKTKGKGVEDKKETPTDLAKKDTQSMGLLKQPSAETKDAEKLQKQSRKSQKQNQSSPLQDEMKKNSNIKSEDESKESGKEGSSENNDDKGL